MTTSRPAIGVTIIVLVVIVVAVIATAGFLSLTTQSAPNPSSTESSPTSTALVINNINLQIPQNEPTCLGPPAICTIAQLESDVQLSGTVSVNASTPLSCLDVYVNGSSEGSTCWTLNVAAFTETECNGSGNQTSCSLVVNNNTNTETARTIAFGQTVFNGTDNTPFIFAGKTYQITIVGEFQDGSNSTASAIVVATTSRSLTVETVSTVSTTSVTSQRERILRVLRLASDRAGPRVRESHGLDFCN